MKAKVIIRKMVPYILLTIIIIGLLFAIEWFSTDLIDSGHLRFITFLVVIIIAYLIFQFLWSMLRAPSTPFCDTWLTQIKYRKKFKEQKAITAILQEYDPERFLAETQRFLADEKLPQGLARVTSDNCAAGFVQKGEFEPAIAIWHRTVVDEAELRNKSKHGDDFIKTVAHANLCYAYLKMSEVEKAKVHYDSLIEMKNAKNLNTSTKAWIERAIVNFSAKFLIAEGRYADALKPTLENLKDEKTWDILDAYFELATIYGQLGDLRKQTEQLEKIVMLGNKHYYVAIARDKLAELSIKV